MANLTLDKQSAWVTAFETAQDLGLSDEEAYEVATDWATDTEFGKNPPTVSYDLGGDGKKRPQEPSSDIEEKIAAAAHAYDPTLTTQVFSGQESPLGIGQMSRGGRAKYNGLISQGYTEDTAARMVRASTQGTSLGRHPLGKAADVRFQDISGARLPKNKESQRIADEIAFNFVQATGGNWGRGGFTGRYKYGKPQKYMSLGTAHLDTAPLSRYAPGPHWGAKTDGSLLAYIQAKSLNDLGLTDQSMLPVPTGRGVSRSDHIANALAANTEPEFASQYAPGGLLGTPEVVHEQSQGLIGPPAPRSDYPTGEFDTTPWTDSYAPAPQYAPHTASQDGIDRTITKSIPLPTQAPTLTPGTSNTQGTPMHQRPSPYTGPKKQIFDFVLRQLMNPKPGPK